MYKKKILEKRKVKTLGCLIILFGVSIFLLNYGLSQNNLKSVDKTNSSEDIFTGLKISIAVSPIIIDDTIPGSDWAWAVTQTWCTGSGTEGDPYLLENLEIDGLGGDCINIQNSNAYFIIRTCTLYNGYNAVYLNNVMNGILIENDFSNNVYGTHTYWSSYNEIVGNDFYGDTSGTGISLLFCDNNIIDGNIIENHYQGIRLEDCDENTILGNTAYKNSNYGILLLYGCINNIVTGNIVKDQNYYSGIILLESNFTILSENTIENNPQHGIWVWDSSFNEFSGNIVRNNTLNGFNIQDSFDNIFSENIVIDNNIGVNVDSLSSVNLFYENYFIGNGVHANDYGTNNDWNSALIGNYWDNYTGTDANNDGIGDTPHDFGTGIDYLPIYGPIIIINSPDAGDAFDDAPSFDITIKNYIFSWYSLDGGVTTYPFTGFSGMIDQAAWDAFTDGVIAITFYAKDKAEQVVSAGVIIIKDTETPIIVINSPEDDEVFRKNAPSFDLTVTDLNLEEISYSLDGGVTTFTADATGTIDQEAWAALPIGDVTIMFYAKDEAGHLGYAEVTVQKKEPTGTDTFVGLDFFITSILILMFSGVAITVIIAKIHSKKRIIY